MDKDLLERLGELAESGNSFANSLLNGKYGYRKRGYLTPKQEAAAVSMVERISKPIPSDTLASFNKVYAFLHQARQHLRYPKLMMAMGGRFLKIYISGARSRYPDTVNVVTDDGVWLGRIFNSGEWQHRQGNDELREQAKEILEKIADDPVKAAAESGHLSGNCCFCHRKLTDEKSTSVGYGPVCATNWGLPWGTK